ncbi:replicative DNA helicase [Flavobacterium oncorhynchi]|uniref:Replicative DNA helicase n=1 Tax=Flavobacterium oncorhynchi TaxID=728056 RepID=A0A226I5E2_9FLAO|nr:replicative DNA helicase [Flavobacterium oncorhynchi]OXB01730.1 replicative DNA helicase [Flavobacterium oncorhynchi]
MQTSSKSYKAEPVQQTKIISLEKGKLPPQAIEFEEAILGALMIDTRAIDELLQVFNNPEVFYKDCNKYVFEAIKILSETSQPIDLLTVSNQLRQKGCLDLAGGDFYLIGLTQRIASSAHIEIHARIVLQKYMKRKAIQVASEIIELAYDDDTDVFHLFDYMDVETAKVNEIIEKGRSEMTYADALNAAVERVQMLTDSDNCLTGVDTGFKKLNKHFGGWQPTDFIVVGARPGMGKTAFVTNTMLGAAKAGDSVGFISLEMSTEQLATRTIANESNFHLNQLTKTGFEKPEYFSGLLRKVNELKSLPIFIDDRPALTIGEIKRKARLYKRKHNIKLLIVDYIQLAGSDGNEDIRVRVGKISNGLKAIAKELGITVIGLAQLSREVEKTAYKRPALHHLKESGDIEQDADAVCFIYRPAYYGLEVDHDVIDDDCNTEFIVAKYRHGGVGTIGLHYDENKTKFTDNEIKEELNDSYSSNVIDIPKAMPNEAFYSIDDVSDGNDSNGIDF